MNVKEFLLQEGYSSVRQWAEDSGFTLNDKGEWVDDFGHLVDVELILEELILDIFG